MNEAVVINAEPSGKLLESIREEISFPTRYVRFTRFELDLHRQRLFCEGVSVVLSGKLFGTLTVLLRHPRQIVSREILRNHVWPGNEGADVDSNLNTTVNKLRRILRDAAAEDPLIQTIARRGYLFSAKVEYAERPMSEDSRTEGIDNEICGFRWIQAAKAFCLERSGACLRASLILLVIASLLLGAAVTLFAHRPMYHP
jgi:DNA-binding winged helix-turn-helix (wHTH) protein